MNVSRSAARLNWLPADATNISYRRGGAFDPMPLAVELDIGEQSFRDWARDQGWQLAQGERRAYRYDFSLRAIDRALWYTHMTSPDSGVHAVYDLDAGRAYYHSHSR